MSDYTQNIGGTSQNAALLHTLQRHRDILQDYSHEFQKTRANIVAQREREDLLGSVRRDIKFVQFLYIYKYILNIDMLLMYVLVDFQPIVILTLIMYTVFYFSSYKTTGNRAQDLYLKEHEHIRK
jgi:hypothetical protein